MLWVIIMGESVQEIINLLHEISEDECISNGVKERIVKSLGTMYEEMDVSIKANKVLNELEELLENSGLDTYVRTQIWSVTSLLETI